MWLWTKKTACTAALTIESFLLYAFRMGWFTIAKGMPRKEAEEYLWNKYLFYIEEIRKMEDRYV